MNNENPYLGISIKGLSDDIIMQYLTPYLAIMRCINTILRNVRNALVPHDISQTTLRGCIFIVKYQNISKFISIIAPIILKKLQFTPDMSILYQTR